RRTRVLFAAFPYTTPFRSAVRFVVRLTGAAAVAGIRVVAGTQRGIAAQSAGRLEAIVVTDAAETGVLVGALGPGITAGSAVGLRSREQTAEPQARVQLVCR